MIPTSDAKKGSAFEACRDSDIKSDSSSVGLEARDGYQIGLPSVQWCSTSLSYLVVRPFRLRGHVTFSTVCYTILCDIHLFSEPDWNRHCHLNLEDLAVKKKIRMTLRQMICEYIKLLCKT